MCDYGTLRRSTRQKGTHMRRSVIVGLGAAVIAMLGASSAARAALVDFGVAALGGTLTYTGGPTLDESSSLDLDDSLLIVTTIGPGDQSGLGIFPAGESTVTLTSPINYGSGSGTVNTPIMGGDIFKMWAANDGDVFTETLTTVMSIDRTTPDAITVKLSGTLGDTDGLFVDTPAELILSANQVGGPGAAVGASMTNTANTGVIPEPSTWVMMALGFGALGYAGFRRRKAMLSA
jgi:hypothetical protein